MGLTKEGGERKWQRNFPAWVEKCSMRHGGIYSYPTNERTIDANGRWKVEIVCPEHGSFWMSPEKHAFGQGCPKCSGIGTDKVAEVKGMYPNFHWPDNLEIPTTKTPLHLNCPAHGEFVTTFNRLQTIHKEVASPCPKCNKLAGGLMRRKSVAKWVSQIGERYDGKLSVDPATILTASHKARFVCTEHGEFWSVLCDVLSGHGCFECGRLRRNAEASLNPEDFLTKAREVHGDTYDYDLSTLVSSKRQVVITCKTHGEFSQIAANHTNGAGCPTCSNSVSSGELEIAEWLEGLGVDVVKRDRKQLGGKEIDIYLPKFNLGIEYCGLYWHSEDRLGATYHKDKLDLAKSSGIRLVTVFEDEWLDSPEKVKGRIKVLLGGCPTIMARKTDCRKIVWAQAYIFLTEQHMQGAGAPSAVCYGLYHAGELVMVATFGLGRFSSGHAWELIRVSGSGSLRVVGGLGKLLAKFQREFQPGNIITYADLRWGDGESYGKVGFEYDGCTKPGYFWCKQSGRFSRYDFQKHKLKNVLERFDEELSEADNCRMNGYWRIFDCGHSRWVWKRKA